ncbi:hypothetical protein [Streptosporangium pseudovulgare]|uniref:WYL domain-containing protein n=1 Tax=Streptosporangium pseudovulgare TaxID=35765 RepID=A0ABQ2RAF4_9ACTN|nr:hypothetical protein [Streptosporangium pseudovulgare]GGQ15913.1 hypothetical protein GCM10010140_52770 [Streptosporangium pseudovulgare]
MDHSKALPPGEATPADQAQPAPLTRRPVLGTVQEDQYIHLVRLAWDLRGVGVAVRLELPLNEEPYLTAQGMRRPVRVIAYRFGEYWIYQWGRGRNQRIGALDQEAAQEIRKAAAR